MDDQQREANRRMWDERVPIHVASDFYDVEGFLKGESHLRPFERTELGDVQGKSLVHLQCHIGLDTLSWAREGAVVTGLDFSKPAIEAARTIAKKAQLKARFEEADVFDAAKTLQQRYDIVYTGLGAINWFPDLYRWSSVVNDLLKPGGRLYLAEFHPFTNVFGETGLCVENPYFDGGSAYFTNKEGTYTDGSDKATSDRDSPPTKHNESYEWTHPVSSVVTSLLQRGLVLEAFSEHDFTLYQRLPQLVHHPSDRTYRFKPGGPNLPMMYSIKMRKSPSAEATTLGS